MSDKTPSQHTPGPWIAAPYSSVVGAPVVASPSGRSICRVTYFDLGDAFANHDRESAANARLISAAPELVSALERLLIEADKACEFAAANGLGVLHQGLLTAKGTAGAVLAKIDKAP